MAEETHSHGLSPYHYANNDPINHVDPSGLDWYRNDESGEAYWQAGDGAVDGATHLGANHVIEGANGKIYHEQNEVVAYERTSGDPSSGAGETMAGAMAVSAGLVADDVTGVGVVDDIAIPFILGGASLYAGYQYFNGPPDLVPGFNDPYIQRARDNSKNEQHGDGGRSMSKAERQIQELEQKAQRATGNLKKDLLKKIRNVKRTAEKNRKGENHSRRGKG